MNIINIQVQIFLYYKSINFRVNYNYMVVSNHYDLKIESWNLTDGKKNICDAVLPPPHNIPVSILHSVFVKGDLVNFELGEDDLEASQLYPNYNYMSIDQLLDKFLVDPPPPASAAFEWSCFTILLCWILVTIKYVGTLLIVLLNKVCRYSINSSASTKN